MTEVWLAGPVTSAAYGWRLERRDGVALGFTSHDRDIEIGGLLLRASPGIMPTVITESMGLDVGGLDVSGALSSDAIREDDLLSGRWDGARLSIFLFDWSAPLAGQRILAVGELGGISLTGPAFEAEFKGPAAKLDRPIAPYTSPSCRADFCDQSCGLNAARFRTEMSVASTDGGLIGFASALPGAVNDFAFGKLRWLDGDNCGLVSEILSSTANAVHLAHPPYFAVEAGARVVVNQGCDKVIATCSTRFGNAVNFRGEPFLPGNDILTRYPGAS